ncbi:GroES-like protein [Trametes coccinea BRFM310]|uniref:GroES-like protein n=1 Tax=Trametes coccinea (strain BRFM310) TaxID=1353009 RepID=A0A1Y2IUF5_TRAC3|nr:GroES-like protein [Trametes coccinea BRFM310]
MSIPTQQYALVVEKKQGPLELKQIDVPQPGEGELLVRIEATALNPADWKILDHGILVEKFPAILGFDGAGVVVKVGSAIKDYAVGDRVLFQTGTLPEDGTAIGTFQQYVRVRPTWGTKIPNNVSFEAAATVPSGLASTALALYSRVEGAPSAKLIAPWEEGGRGYYAGKPIFILGGATSLGQYAIQLARLSGFSPIITTASLHNAELLKSLGATHVLDRKLPSETLVKEAIGIAGKHFDLVYDAVSEPETLAPGYQATSPTGVFIVVLTNPVPGADANSQKQVHLARGFFTMPFNLAASAALLAKLPELLEKGEIKTNRVEVISGGLRGVAAGLERLRRNEVSAVKLVVRPQETAL